MSARASLHRVLQQRATDRSEAASAVAAASAAERQDRQSGSAGESDERLKTIAGTERTLTDVWGDGAGTVYARGVHVIDK